MTERKYLGEVSVIVLTGTPFEGFGRNDWALHFILQYGGIDGAHHKQWVIDQVAQILLGSPVLVYLARWSDGHSEYRVRVHGRSAAYQRWLDTEANTDEYQWDHGVPP